MGKKGLTFTLCLVGAIALTMVLRDGQFTDSQTYVLFLLFFAIGLWLTEAIPAFSVGLFILAFLVFALGNARFNSNPEEIGKYVNTFSSSIIWLMLGGFFLASALTKTGLDADLFRFTMRMSGTTPKRILLGLMLTTMTASMLMSNTATTAMVIASVMPLLNGLGKESPLSKGLLVGIPLAATVGGMGTIIGTPPNAIAAGALENAGVPVDFLGWMKYGIPLSIVLTGVGYFAITRVYVTSNEPLSEALLRKEGAAGSATASARRVVVATVIATLLLWMTGSLHQVSVSAVAALPIVVLTMTGILDARDMRELPWDTLLLVAGGLSLGLALQETGLLDHYAGLIAAVEINDIALLGLFAFATMIFSNIMSNTATSTVLIPLGMTIVPAYKVEVALIIGFAASTALFLPVSTPPNAIAFSTGFLNQRDFRLGGGLIGVLGPLAVIACVLLLS
jgi:sodium-dependent dicarboxylate transporter 2/3/5